MEFSHELIESIFSKCDIIFEGEPISKEHLLRVYSSFITSTFCKEKHNVEIVLHTGSICFNVITVTMSAISNLIFNETTPDDIVASLKIGDTVLYGSGKKQRYIFKGVLKGQSDGKFANYVWLSQSGGSYVYVSPFLRQHIEPYKGRSSQMDGRGIRKGNITRLEFISEVLGSDTHQIPSVVNSSSIIVMPREVADRIINGIKFRFGTGKEIKLLEVLTASYFTENEEHQYSGNPGKLEPVLKITNKVSVARDLAFSKNGNKILGLSVLDDESISRGRTELPELMNRNSLKFVIVSCQIDAEGCDSLIKESENPNVFACTKEFLLMNNKPPTALTPLTRELEKQVNNTITHEVEPLIIPTAKTWNDFRDMKRSLFAIRNAEIIDGNKEYFLIHAHSLLNLFLTSVFSLNFMEKLIETGRLDIVSPKTQLEKLRDIENRFPMVYQEKIKSVISQLQNMYSELIDTNLKGIALKKHLVKNSKKIIAIIVPKAYYADILYAQAIDKICVQTHLIISTANKFDGSKLYDEIIVTGDFRGKRFDTFICRAAPIITPIIYDYESNILKYKMKSAMRLEQFLNERTQVSATISENVDNLFYDQAEVTDETIKELETAENELIQYVNRANELAAIGILSKRGNNGSSVTTEVVMVGTFSGGEKAFFTKAYKAYVFDSTEESVNEEPISNLTAGDTLVFTKNTSFTKDIVDGILRQLLETNTIDENVKVAFQKSKYWKEVLREYMKESGYSYRKLTTVLIEFGCVKTEVTIRSWLDDDAHIVGPLEDVTYLQIAEMTNNNDMLKNPSEYCTACNTIRKVRRHILKLIGTSIINKLCGRLPNNDLLLKAVSNNIDELAVILQLESITEIESIQVPVNLTNHPISI